jgi:short-subunit dehydrogenase
MNGKVLITGGSRGIGDSLSRLLISEEYEVYSLARSTSSFTHPNFIQLEYDLSNVHELSRFIDEFLKKHGVPDLLINNAGYGTFSEWDQFPESEIHRQLDVLFKAPVILCQKLVPLMAERKSGVVINLSSLATLYPLPFMPLYNAGKSALSSFTQSLMLEYRNHPVFIDFRMGDVKTGFNDHTQKSNRSERLNIKNAWRQIDKQLNHSISPEKACDLIWRKIKQGQSGTFYGGTKFHGFLLPFMESFLTHSMKMNLITKWYQLQSST